MRLSSMRSAIVLCAVGLLIPLASSGATDTTFPEGGTLRIIVPYPAGGTADLSARLVADRLSSSLKVPVVLDFRPGGNLVIGTQAAISAEPDGRTLFLGTATSQVLNPLLRSNLPYDPVRDFAPVSELNTSAYLIAVPVGSPAKSLSDVVAVAKSKPAQLSYGSFGAGNITHLATEAFSREAGISLNHIPYKGSSQSEIDLIAGRIDMAMTTFTAMSHVADGKLRLLATTGSSRIVADVPTVSETEFKGFDVIGWFALFVPKGTPPAIVQVLNKATREALTDKELIRRYAALGLTATGSSPEELSARVSAEYEKWSPIVQALGLRDSF